MLWAAAFAAAAAIAALLIVLLAHPGSEGPEPMTTPTTTATGDTTATATAAGTGGPTATVEPTATAGATDTAGGTSVPQPTEYPKVTAVPTADGYQVFFTRSGYGVSGEGTDFYTTINITPIELLFAAQFVLEWDCTLFELRTGWTQNSGGGRLYNGTSPNPGWTGATSVGLNPTGDNPQCPDPKQGRANFLVDWSNYQHVPSGFGVNVSREGTIVTLGWRTYSGADFRAGTTDIGFAPTLKLVGFKTGAYDYTRPVAWMDTSVTVD